MKKWGFKMMDSSSEHHLILKVTKSPIPIKCIYHDMVIISLVDNQFKDIFERLKTGDKIHDARDLNKVKKNFDENYSDVIDDLLKEIIQYVKNKNIDMCSLVFDFNNGAFKKEDSFLSDKIVNI